MLIINSDGSDSSHRRFLNITTSKRFRFLLLCEYRRSSLIFLLPLLPTDTLEYRIEEEHRDDKQHDNSDCRRECQEIRRREERHIMCFNELISPRIGTVRSVNRTCIPRISYAQPEDDSCQPYLDKEEEDRRNREAITHSPKVLKSESGDEQSEEEEYKPVRDDPPDCVVVDLLSETV